MENTIKLFAQIKEEYPLSILYCWGSGGKNPMGFVLTNTETKDNPLFKMRPNASREELTDIMVMSMVAHIANDRGVLVKDYVKNMLYNAKRMNRGLGV